MWITLVTADIKLRLSQAEFIAVQTTLLASGLSDPVPEVLTETADEVRGYVAACASNALGLASTIPQRLKAAALDIATWKLGLRLGQKSILTDERKMAYEEAIKLLIRVSECKFAVEGIITPDAEVTQSNAVEAEAFTDNTRVSTRTLMSGL